MADELDRALRQRDLALMAEPRSRGVAPRKPGILDIGNGVTERLAFLNQTFNPVEGIGSAMRAGSRMVAPDQSYWDRIASLGEMASGVASIAAPMAAAKAIGVPAASAMMEGLLGFSPAQQAAGDTMRAVGRDVVERLNQPGQMPTVYSNPIPGVGRPPQDIEGTLQAKYPDVKLSISGSPERGYTLNKIDVPKGKRESGLGTAVMNDLVNLADQQGAVLKLSPSGDFGGSVPRLKDFYARFGFVQNKGRNADYAISESMYRNPAPAAPSSFRLYQGSPHDFAAERLVRMPDGSTQYIVGSPNVLPDVPPGAEVLRDFPLGRQRMDKIGTGEGAQAYGYGLYGAEAEGVARGYRDTLSDPDALPLQFDGRPVNTPWNEEIRNRWPDYFSGLNQSDADAMEELLGNLSQVNNMADVPDVLGGVSSRAKALYSRIVKPKLTKPDVGAGSMYELEVNANPENFLDWDRPLSEQSQPVRDALGRLGITSAESGNEAYMRSSLQRFAVMKPDGTFGPGPDTYDEALALVGGDPSKVRRISEGSAPMRSEALRREGIPGIRYLDEKSRSKPYVVDLGYKGKPFEEGYFEPQFARSKEEAESIAREYQGKGYDANVRDIATRNYVIFDENLINIVRKYGIAGAATMLGVSAFDVEQALAENMSPSQWDQLVVGPQ